MLCFHKPAISFKINKVPIYPSIHPSNRSVSVKMQSDLSESYHVGASIWDSPRPIANVGALSAAAQRSSCRWLPDPVMVPEALEDPSVGRRSAPPAGYRCHHYN